MGWDRDFAILLGSANSPWIKILDKCLVWGYGSRISLYLVWFLLFFFSWAKFGETCPPLPLWFAPMASPPFRGDNWGDTLWQLTRTMLAISLSFHFLELFLRIPAVPIWEHACTLYRVTNDPHPIFYYYLSSHKHHISRALLDSNCLIQLSNYG